MNQKFAFDSCVVISLLRQPYLAEKIRAGFEEKPTTILLFDKVIEEVTKGGTSCQVIIDHISKLFGCRIDVVNAHEYERQILQLLAEKYSIIHQGDDQILVMSKAREAVLVSFDNRLIRLCNILGVSYFNPMHQEKYEKNDYFSKLPIQEIIFNMDRPSLLSLRKKQIEYYLEYYQKKYRYHKRKAERFYDKIEDLNQKLDSLNHEELLIQC